MELSPFQLITTSHCNQSRGFLCTHSTQQPPHLCFRLSLPEQLNKTSLSLENSIHWNIHLLLLCFFKDLWSSSNPRVREITVSQLCSGLKFYLKLDFSPLCRINLFSVIQLHLVRKSEPFKNCMFWVKIHKAQQVSTFSSLPTSKNMIQGIRRDVDEMGLHLQDIKMLLQVSLSFIIHEPWRMFHLVWPSCWLCKAFTNVVCWDRKLTKSCCEWKRRSGSRQTPTGWEYSCLKSRAEEKGRLKADC